MLPGVRGGGRGRGEEASKEEHERENKANHTRDLSNFEFGVSLSITQSTLL
jgi:hypothetical protein